MGLNNVHQAAASCMSTATSKSLGSPFFKACGYGGFRKLFQAIF